MFSVPLWVEKCVDNYFLVSHLCQVEPGTPATESGLPSATTRSFGRVALQSSSESPQGEEKKDPKNKKDKKADKDKNKSKKDKEKEEEWL